MANLSAIGQRVRIRMFELNIGTVKELEIRAGLPKDTIRHLVSGRTKSVRSSKLTGLAAALEMTVDELVHGIKRKDGAESLQMTVSSQDEPATVLGRLQIDDALLGRFGASGSASHWLISQMDNMAPTIGAGDMVLVDSSVTRAECDGIYSVANSSCAHTFRRIQLSAAGGMVSILNDNPRYGNESGVNPADVRVVGRVLGVYRNL